ncbi:transcription repressor OFP13 [Salvia miltiorrhiza]|uniref:transcription repressor OFP13 n=1 Tax=Salvia miltiorrhiza TaxID=226208 RepID=UPI0025ABAFF8|nr:transcription repressor OFP13 [Salvia miltiorrhiza]
MSKKMKMPSIFKSKDPKQPWQWPSCNHPKTLSFRASNDVVFKTVNSVFLDTSDGLDTPESWFTNSSSDCASTTDDHSEDYNNNNNNNNETLEMIIRDVRSSDRLFFEPGDTSSIFDKEPAAAKETTTSGGPFEESVALALESDDPYMDFKKSMQEMVESHGLEEWDRLEELLGWYLKMNAKHNHGFIVGAFVDLLVGMVKDSPAAAAVCRSDSTSYSSADSCFSSPSSPVRDRVEGGDAINVQS